MKTFNKFLALGLVFALFSCEKEVDNLTQNPTGRATLNTNSEQLSQRISYVNEVINVGKTSSANHTFTLVGDVAAPSNGVSTFYATSVEFHGNYAYVTYHIKGEGYGGYLEVFDVSDPTTPVIVSQLYLSDTDMHTVEVNSSNVLWMSGARDIYSSGYALTNHAGAVLMEVPLTAGALTSTVNEIPLPSYATNSVVELGSKLYTTAGDVNGGVFTVNKSTFTLENTSTSQDLFDDAEYLATDGLSILAIEGGQSAAGNLRVYGAPSDLSTSVQVPLPYSSTKVGKNVIKVKDGLAYLAMGDDGLLTVNVSSQVKTQYTQGATSSGVDVDDDYIYMANTDGGLVILDKTNPATVEGTYTYTGSANYVSTNGNLIFIANGEGGLKILRKDAVLDPYCTNQTVIQINSGLTVNNQVKLTAMGTYVEVNGTPMKRWRLRNQTAQTETFNWEIYGGTETGTLTIPSQGEAFFSTNSGGTMRVFLNSTLKQTKAHGGSTRYMATCSSTPPPSSCSSWPSLPGGTTWLTVNSGQVAQYNLGGSSITGINVNSGATLDMCGSLAVSSNANINANMSMEGSMTVQNVYINSGGTFDMEGSLVIYGDLIINSGATLNFNGSGSTITVLGNVINNGGTVSGSYTGTPL